MVPSPNEPLKKSVLRQRKDKTVLSMELITWDLEVDTVKVFIVREVGAGHNFGDGEVAPEVVVAPSATATVLFCDNGEEGLRLIIGLKNDKNVHFLLNNNTTKKMYVSTIHPKNVTVIFLF